MALRTGSAFLLTQLGTHAARLFAERIAAIDLTPPQTGLLRVVGARPGLSQQALAGHLGMPPTRLVALVDALEARQLVERRRNPDDRRLYALHLTDAAATLMADIGRVAQAHEEAILAALDPAERTQLHGLLSRVAADQGLTVGVHPGYRDVGA